MTSAPPVRVVLAKVGLDGHDRGIKVVARGLRDAGCHVIYAGLWQTPEAVVRTVADEDADVPQAGVAQGAGDDLDAAVVAVEAHLGENDADGSRDCHNVSVCQCGIWKSFVRLFIAEESLLE